MNLPEKQGSSVRDALEAERPFDVEVFAARYGGTTRSAFSRGDRLYTQGDAADCLFYLVEGQVRLTVVNAQGKEAIITLLARADFCGEDCLFEDRPRGATAICLTDGAGVRLDRASVVRAIREDRLFTEFYLLYNLNRTVQLRDSLISQLFDTSEQRLARVLLLLANYRKGDEQEATLGKLDQEDLAKMVGTTRSRINHFMNKFRRLGYIDYNGHISVHRSLLNTILDGATKAVADRNISSE